MAEEQDQGHNTPSEGNDTSQGEERPKRTLADGSDPEKLLSYNRGMQIQKENRELKRRLEEIEEQQTREAEERAKKQGEYQKLADKYKGQVETEKQKRQAAENQLVRYKQLQTWREAARGVILDEAIDHAFDDLNTDDLAGMEETDVAGMTRLAEMLADSRSYYAAGPRGAGSGFGSRTPVLERPSGSRQQPESNAKHKPIFKRRTRRQWK